jgi:hypothetical protein
MTTSEASRAVMMSPPELNVESPVMLDTLRRVCAGADTAVAGRRDDLPGTRDIRPIYGGEEDPAREWAGDKQTSHGRYQ